MRAFRCVPVSLKYDPVLATLTSFERDLVFSALIAQDDRHCLPFDAATLRSEVFPSRHFVAVREIAKARDKLLAIGVFSKKTSTRREWLEITPSYRHEEGRKETGFGDHAPPAEQSELSLGPMLLAPTEPSLMPSMVEFRNPSRTESKQSKAPESARARAARPSEDSGFRSNGSVGDPERFARDASAVEDPLWKQLCDTLGRLELQQNGASWLRRLRTNRDALAIALRDYRDMTPARRALYPAALYITTAFENEKRRVG